MKPTKLYTMLMVQDMARAVTFYRDAFELEVATQSPGWSELRHGEAIIALHGGGADGGPTSLGFEVADLEGACRSIVAAGGRVTKAPYPGGAPGVMLAEGADTEGNRFSLAQTGGEEGPG